MEMEVEEKTAIAEANKPKPVRPRPRVKTTAGKGGKHAASHTTGNDGITDVITSDDGSRTLTRSQDDGPGAESDHEVGIMTVNVQKKPVSLKAAINKYKLNHKKVADKKLPAPKVAPKETSKKFAFGGQVKNWAVNVADANKSAGSTTSTTHMPPSTTISHLVISHSSAATSLGNQSHTPAAPTNTPETTSFKIFADEVDEAEERAATLSWSKARVNTDREILSIIPASESNVELEEPLSQFHIASSSIKRKADTLEAADIVSDSEPECDPQGPDAMEIDEPAPEDIDTTTKIIEPTPVKGRGHCTTAAASVGITQAPLPPPKKVKLEESEPTIVAPLNTSLINIAASDSQVQGTSIWYDADGYILKTIKKRNKYSSKDLPVPGDNRWSRGVIATITLWCSVQPNVWSIPEEQMAPALQVIFDNVYPGIKYRVTPAGSIFAIYNDDIDIPAAAAGLFENYKFLQEDPDDPSPECLFHSPFLIQLLASTHLSDITGFVNIPGWNTTELTRGKDHVGVIALGSAARGFSGGGEGNGWWQRVHGWWRLRLGGGERIWVVVSTHGWWRAHMGGGEGVRVVVSATGGGGEWWVVASALRWQRGFSGGGEGNGWWQRVHGWWQLHLGGGEHIWVMVRAHVWWWRQAHGCWQVCLSGGDHVRVAASTFGWLLGCSGGGKGARVVARAPGWLLGCSDGDLGPLGGGWGVWVEGRWWVWCWERRWGGQGVGVLERAVQFIMDGTINVKQILADMAESPEGKMKVMLPKVLNKATGRETSGPYMFSSTNWGGNTAGYRESIFKRGAGFTRDMIAAAQHMKSAKAPGSDVPSSACDTLESGVNPRAFLCKI
ncbi:hypothetical protein HYDPIDRAFT_165537 [Hydnomerulius pinastri MD-312]|nr:hypothetical protein HYDPIDRAFT_165537 [Hydnomerulius pinastri MD-312]